METARQLLFAAAMGIRAPMTTAREGNALTKSLFAMTAAVVPAMPV